MAAVIMLLVMSFIIGNRVFYVHTHLNRYGNPVTHSHPFDKDSDKLPLKSHHHNDAVLALLGVADQTVVTASSGVLAFPDRLTENLFEWYNISYTIPSLLSNTNRGPPVI